MPKKCGSCGHQLCSSKDMVPDTKENRSNISSVCTLSGKIIYQCGCTVTRDHKHAYCCKCKDFTPLVR